ncbi:MAG TPA: crossover junction endodeoxyribonuclease RuvC [Thermoanaerobaculia bacterium]
MRILGIDPGSLVTGFGVIDHVKGKLTLVEQGCIRSGRAEALPERLRRIYDALGVVIRATSPAVVAIEAPFHGLNSKSLIQLSHARGVAILAAQTAGLEIFEYSPRTVKSAVVGYGAAEKQQVGKMVRLLIGNGSETFTADAADALAVAICHAHSRRLTIR